MFATVQTSISNPILANTEGELTSNMQTQF